MEILRLAYNALSCMNNSEKDKVKKLLDEAVQVIDKTIEKEL